MTGDGCWGRGRGRGRGLGQGFSFGRVRGWVASGGGGVLGCSRCLGFGSAVPVPHVPGHLTSICKEGVK